MTQPQYAIIVAGGKGTRFGGSLPKQFLELEGKPVLIHTLEAFYRYSEDIRVVLVLPEDDRNTWDEITSRYGYRRPVLVQPGGATRFLSVQNGLQAIGGEGLVAIHDGVRPLVSSEIIRASFDLAGTHGSAVASVTLKDSIRMVHPASAGTRHPETAAADRSAFRIVQTPQTFDAALLKKSYASCTNIHVTDDAAVVEQAGGRIHLFDGSYQNIKVTTPEDLVVAAALLRAGL